MGILDESYKRKVDLYNVISHKKEVRAIKQYV